MKRRPKPCWNCEYPRWHRLCCGKLEHRREQDPAFAQIAREETELLELLESPQRRVDTRPSWSKLLR